MNELSSRKKALGGIDVFLGLISAMLFADLIATNTEMGPSVIVWWIIAGVILFIPNGMVTAELAATYPDQGGIYSWVRRAFGAKWAARTSWYYWINISLFVPASYVWFSGAFFGTFFPEAGYWPEVLLGIGMVWLTVWLCTKKLADSKWVINIAGILKILIFILVIIAGAAFIIAGNQPANVINAQTMAPTLGGSLKYLPVILYLCCGMEILSANAQEMRNPGKDVPKAMLILVIVSIAFNVFASFGMLNVVPIAELDLLTGVHQVLLIAFGSEMIAGIFMCLLLFTVFAGITVWMLGGAVGANEAGKDGELPRAFAKESKKSGAPIGALRLTGVIATAAMVLYGLLAQQSADLFFTLLAFSSILFFVPYLIMFPAFLKLRKTDSTPRPYRAPAGKFLAILCEIVLVFAVVLFVWGPEDDLAFSWEYSLSVIIGVAASVILGEIIVNHMLKKKGRQLE
ncbi:MAG: APC family permease [Christensenellaceae bacterium]|jgi:amino acid transporter